MINYPLQWAWSGHVTKSVTGSKISKFSQIFFDQLYTGWLVVPIWDPICNFGMDKSMCSKFGVQNRYVKLFVCGWKNYPQMGVVWVTWPIL